MPLFASLALLGLGLLPCDAVCALPEAAQDPAPKLSPGELKSLQAKLAKMVDAQTSYDDPSVTGKARDKAREAYEKAKDAFWSEWETRSEKHGDLLKSVPDMEVIFGNCFAYDRKSAMSFRKVDAKERIPAHWLSLPKAYTADAPTRAVLVVPGADESGWMDGKRWFDATWGDKSNLVQDSIIHVPIVSSKIELDPAPDYSKTEAEALERDRNAELMMSFGETQRNLNVDRARRFLDAGKGSCAFAVRMASYFPDLFAGVILRHPTAVDGVRLGSLGGIKFLLLSSAETAQACAALKARFDQIDPEICTVLETGDEYPFKGSASAIESWMANCKRSVNRKKIVLEPNDDRWRKAFWVGIETMDSVHTAPEGAKPRVEVEADKASNRIKVTAVGIEAVYLTLNDSLVDLDKPFTLVVNDKAFEEKRSRNFTEMLKYMRQRFDSEFLFPVQFRVRVPKPEPKATDAGGQ